MLSFPSSVVLLTMFGFLFEDAGRRRGVSENGEGRGWEKMD